MNSVGHQKDGPSWSSHEVDFENSSHIKLSSIYAYNTLEGIYKEVNFEDTGG